MASTKEFKSFILEQLSNLDNITYRQMMGEYILYFNGVIIGGIYDDRFLIKITDSNKAFSLTQQIPYKNAKPMYMVDNLDDKEYLKNIIIETYNGLKKNLSN